MILFDFECSSCGTITEQLVDRDTETIACPVCGSEARKYFGRSAGARLPDSAEWIHSIKDVLDKESKAPHIREFFKSPTRENLQALMKKEGIRHMERGEEIRKRQPDFDEDRMADRLLKQHMERTRIVVRG